MQEIYRFLENINGSESSILVNGDTGTGKELVAHAIHYNSKRKNAPFIIVDCSVLNKNLLESELFGHVKGSFTGAIADKKGLFELADGGTLFLDEIGETSLDTQVKLLRALEEGTFRPVGSSEEKKVSVRIIAATNKDLKMLISNKKFREDLYYRINVINITLPVLKERREDIPLLVEHFMNELNGSNGIKRSLAKEALNQLIEYDYPGNIRELKNIVERSFMLCESDTIGFSDLPVEVRENVRVNTRETELPSDHSESVTLGDIKKHTEREALSRALKQVKGNKLRAAKLLKISRSTLYAKIEEHHIEC
jgi:transcriptional regulator with PAS, ATPase and Fis domain